MTPVREDAVFALTFAPGAAKATRYHVPRAETPVDLFLDGNEGATPDDDLFEALRISGVETVRRYPDATALEAKLAARFGVDPTQVIVTAGGDETIDRACRALLCDGRELILPEPTFEMIARYAALAQGTLVSVEWRGGPFPVEAVLARVGPSTALIAIVTPNNPTGAVATLDDVRRVAMAAPHALVLLDHAYVEFSDADFTQAALEWPNVLVVRTVSKAWGLAGLRIGCGVGHPELIRQLRACGGPYPVSGPSLVLAAAALESGERAVAAFVSTIREERTRLETLMSDLGADPEPSHANFVFGRFKDALWIRDGLAGLGIAVRAFPGRPSLDGCVRITCPGDEAAFRRLTHALHATCAPEAILFDVDGVLVDVSLSYRAAIVETCRHFGVELDADEIAAAKAQGNANNDWVLTHRLIDRHGVKIDFELVKQTFEAAYQGDGDRPGLWIHETLRLPRATLQRLADRYPLALVTGRPRADLERLLDLFDLRPLFPVTVCMEDASLKPDPAPVRLALARLGVTRAWMLGDTPDDQRAARSAGVVPIGVLAPSEVHREPLIRAGASRVLVSPESLEALLP